VKQNDGKAVTMLDLKIYKLNHKNPVKYDFALFGLDVFTDFIDTATS
jgi:hypothetical protein